MIIITSIILKSLPEHPLQYWVLYPRLVQDVGVQYSQAQHMKEHFFPPL